MSRLILILATLATVAVPAPTPTEEPLPTCTTGTPVTTAGYPMSWYAQAVPSNLGDFGDGYQPEPRWAGVHLVGSYDFGVPPPVETGFAYAQFKCELYCKNQNSSSFYVFADPTVGSHCNCYNDLIDPNSFIYYNATSKSLVGAWNAICDA